MAPGRDERRRSKRQRRRLGVRFWSDGMEGSGFTADISNTGLMIETTTPLEIGQRFHLELALPDARSFLAEGVVVRKKVYPRQAASIFKPGVGVRFVGLGEAIRAVAQAEARAPDTPATGGLEPLNGELELDLREPAELSRIYEDDIKHGGVRVPTACRPAVNEDVTVVLLLPQPNGSISCRGSVVAHITAPPGVGVRLHEIDPVRVRLLEILGRR